MTSPAVEYKKNEDEKDESGVVILSTGYKARMVPVGASLIDDIAATIPMPDIPKWYNEDKGREEDNPTDEGYIKACEVAERKRAIAAMEALLVFGLELDIPEDEKWISRLKFLEKRGNIDLSDIDFEDPDERDLAFKKYVAVGTQDLINLGKQAGLAQTDVEEVTNRFRS
ncbi:hypothetical protein GF380_01770 [Candidatus Uhrbacteria bacterium]|nr:hypothetical protein [Candidatus Uhrbacteria bacterium]